MQSMRLCRGGIHTMRRSKITGLLLIMGMFLAGCGANSGSAGIEMCIRDSYHSVCRNVKI